MARRPTINDVARAAGVSVATVDRVLNARLPVREATARRVYEAAETIGYHAAGVIRLRLQRDPPRHRLGFILQRRGQTFYQHFAAVIEAAAARGGASAEVAFLESQAPGEVAALLRDVGSRSHSVAMVAVDHPAITTAVAELRERGVPVFSLLSDFAIGVRHAYVGLDNRKAGRTSAWAVARTARPGKVAVLVGSHRFQGHDLREVGFRSYLREHAPGFEVIDTMLSLEDRGIAHESTLELLRRFPDLSGLYVAGGGMEGVISALREESMAGRLAMVCNEIIPETRAALVDGIATMVIATPVATISAELVRQMVLAIEQPDQASIDQLFLPFDIFVSENV